MAPAGQLGVVVRVFGRDELQAGVAHQVPAFTAHVLWKGENRKALCCDLLKRLETCCCVANTATATWQGDALLVTRLPLTVLVHSTALAAGFLVAHIRRVVSGAHIIFPYGPLGGNTNNEN